MATKRFSDLLATAGSLAIIGASTLFGLGGVSPNEDILYTMPQVRAYCSPSFVSPVDYGFRGDGSSHPLSDLYVTLAGARAAYDGAFYFVTSLTQQQDYAACKAASNAAFGADLEILTAYVVVSEASDDMHIVDATQSWTVNEHAGRTAFRKFESNGFVTSITIASNTATVLTLAAPMPFGAITSLNEYAIGYGEHGSNSKLNTRLVLPSGRGVFGNDTWLIRNLASGLIEGQGRLATTLTSNVPVLALDGCWYSEFSNFSMLAVDPGAVVAFDLDGNVPGHPYATRGVQGVTLRNILIDGAMSEMAFAMTRVGGDAGQGSECSYLNVHVSSATFACYYQNGFNALANQWYGGNVQNYTTHGMYVVGGTIGVYGTGFQSTRGYVQIENGGADIYVGDSGAYGPCPIYGCRTESLVFLINAGAAITDVRACVGNVALPGWFADVEYGAAAALYKAVNVSGRLFVATTEGTSGAIIPDFAAVADLGTVADNDIIWTHTQFNVVQIPSNAGSIDYGTSSFSLGDISAPFTPRVPRVVDVDTRMLIGEHLIGVDASGGNRIVVLPSPTTQAMRGYEVVVKKVDTSANTVTVSGNSMEGGGVTLVIPGGSRGKLRLVWMDSSTGGGTSWMDVT